MLPRSLRLAVLAFCAALVLTPHLVLASKDQGRLDANNLDMTVTNHGSFAYDYVNGGPGLVYPKGSAHTVMFSAGPWLAAKVQGHVRVALAEYAQEFVPGPMVGGVAAPDQPRFRCYKITRGNTTDPDYLSWPSDLGAPVDSLGAPALLGDAMIWSVYNDADSTAHTNPAGSTGPLGVEVRQSTYSFNRAGSLGNIIFVRFQLGNKGGRALDSMYVGCWVDPDLGGFTDDLVGCDTTRSLGYCYNATNADAEYGSNPPALGLCLVRGITSGSDTLCMTGFTRYLNGTDPGSAAETFNFLKGCNADGSPLHEYDLPAYPITPYSCSGDPTESGGWLDTNPGDRRLLLSTGPFSMAPGDSQDVLYAICIGLGPDRLSSITALRAVVDAIGGGCGKAPQIPTAIAAALLDSEVRADRVRLVWAVTDADQATADVFRSRDGEAWTHLGAAIPEGTNRLAFEDRSMDPGQRYEYRLLLRSSSGEEVASEVWVDVPGEGAPVAASFRVTAENPSGGTLRLRYGLPADGPARVEVYDVHGRKVAILTDGLTKAGWHEVQWTGRGPGGDPVASGVYLLRFVSRDGVLSRKAVIAR